MPDRIVQTQQREMDRYRALDERVKRAAAQTTTAATDQGQRSSSSVNPAGLIRSPRPADAASYSYGASRRKRSSRKSIWNAVLDEEASLKPSPTQQNHRLRTADSSPDAAAIASTRQAGGHLPTSATHGRSQTDEATAWHALSAPASCPSCTGADVELLGTRGGAGGGASSQTKGEVWGNKDTMEQVWNRYRCLSCGKVWNEEE
jgi:rubredoxin